MNAWNNTVEKTIYELALTN